MPHVNKTPSEKSASNKKLQRERMDSENHLENTPIQKTSENRSKNAACEHNP